jgi:microsomal epoxide hydrolase
MSVTPFTVPVEAAEVDWIMERVKAHRWIPEPANAGWAYGANRQYLEGLREHWLTRFDWPAAVAGLNALPHFRAPVGDLNLHFIHRRSSRADARPLLISHGWPGSVFEFAHLIDRLAEPEDPAAPAFHVVAPSLPGFAWSDAPTAPIGPRAVAGLYDRLMTEVLGYPRYIAQGGDWGCVISAWLGLDSSAVTAIHLNGYGLRNADMAPQSEAEGKWLAWALRIRETETAYLMLQGTKPQSLGYAMMDSPMGVAAWLAEKFCGWSDLSADDGRPASAQLPFTQPPFTYDQMLTNIMIYLTTRSFVTATWIYRGMFEEGGFTIPEGRRIEQPVGVAAFPHDLLAFPPRSMVERGYNVVHWTDMPRGGHFASLEEPELFLTDVRRFVASL